MFSKTSEFRVAGEVPVTEPKSELEQLQAKWYSALEEAYQSKLLKVLKLKQDDRERLFYVMAEHSSVQPLKTVVMARTLRDDLSLFNIKITYVTVAGMGTRQEAEFTLVKDPKALGIGAEETMRLVNGIIKGQT